MRIENRTEAFEWYHFQWCWTTPTKISRSRYYRPMMLNISETVRDRPTYIHVVTMKCYGLMHALLKGVISNDLEWPWVTAKYSVWPKHRAVSLRQLSFLYIDICRFKTAAQLLDDGFIAVACCNFVGVN